jgi:GTP1/Obg family GTP-binding protein
VTNFDLGKAISNLNGASHLQTILLLGFPNVGKKTLLGLMCANGGIKRHM